MQKPEIGCEKVRTVEWFRSDRIHFLATASMVHLSIQSSWSENGYEMVRPSPWSRIIQYGLHYKILQSSQIIDSTLGCKQLTSKQVIWSIREKEFRVLFHHYNAKPHVPLMIQRFDVYCYKETLDMKKEGMKAAPPNLLWRRQKIYTTID